MAFWDRFRTNNEIREEQIVPPVDDVLLRALLSSETITREKALTLPAVAGAVDFISNAVACMPVKLYQIKDDKVEEVKDDSRTKLLNGDTGDTLDAFQMKKAMVTDYLMGKGGYCYIRKNRNKVTGLFYVQDMYVDVMILPEPIYKDYQILIMGKAYKPFEFIKLLRNTKDGASGTGLTDEISKELETAYQTLLYQLGMVKSGGNKRGFLKADRKLGQDEIDVLKQAWRNMYGNNTESVVVLNNGLQFQEASSSSVEMQMNESKRTLNDEIYDLFHIHPNDFERTFKEAIYPIIKAFETALNRDLLLEREKADHFYEFDVKEIVKASLNERYSAYKTAKETGFMTLNEIRRAENLNWIEGLDVVNVGLGAVLYDVDEKKYFTPNTGEATDIQSATQKKTEDMIEAHEEVEAFDESGNSAERELRYNENHDPKTGKFTTGKSSVGSAEWQEQLLAEYDSFSKLSDNKKIQFLVRAGYLSQAQATKARKDGVLDEKGQEYFDLMAENGDYRPKGATRDNENRVTWWKEDNSIDLIMQDTGFSREQASEALLNIRKYTSKKYEESGFDPDVLENYINASPTYDGRVYRGIHFSTVEEAQVFADLEVGQRIGMRGKISSWTSDLRTAKDFAFSKDEEKSSVVIHNSRNRTGSPIAEYASQEEFEVLASSKAEWTVLRTTSKRVGNTLKVEVFVTEADTNG